MLVLFVLTFMLTYPINSYAEDSAAAATTLSLQEALDKAYNNNPDLNKAGLNVEKALIPRDDSSKLVNGMYISGSVSTSEAAIITAAQQANIAYNLSLRTQERTKGNITLSVIQAYTSILSSSKQMEGLELQMKDIDQKSKLTLLYRVLGLATDFDVDQQNISRKQLQESYTTAKLAYDSSMTTLRELVRENDSWNPTLVSQPVLETYARNDLAMEISRGVAESDSVWSAKADLDIATFQANWVLQGTTSQEQNISTDLAGITYEQAKNSVTTQIEQLYYSIDSLESGIRTAQLNYEQAEANLKMAQIKYDVGVLPLFSLSGECLNNYRTAEENAKISLDTQKNSLVASKAKFAYLTAQNVYDVNDWLNS
jgi:outer membrane protein TolC